MISDSKPLLKVKEVAGLLETHPNHVYRLMSQGRMPGAVRVGSGWRINRKKFYDWLEGSDGDTNAS